MFDYEFGELDKMSFDEKVGFARALEEHCGPDKFFWTERFAGVLPILKHRRSGIEFVYIPSGEYSMGLSESEETAGRAITDPMPATLAEMRPVRQIVIKPFLIARTPILNRTVTSDDSKKDSFHPRFFDRRGAVAVAESFDCRLPHEAEWEYACRANTNTLFTWGDRIPEKAELEKWLAWDLSSETALNCNGFGLLGLFGGEWCLDAYSKSYDIAEPPEPESFVVRGGGAYFWEWQDQEWVWCMSAMRMPSSDLLDGTCGVRMVHDLGDLK